MKPKSKQYNLTITYPITIFLEDIEKISTIIKDNMDKISIENDEFEFENVQELATMKSQMIKNISIIGYKNNWPTFSFYLYPNFVYIKIYQDDHYLLGMMEKIKEIIASRRIPLGLSKTPQIILSFLILFSIIVSIVVNIFFKSQMFLNQFLPIVNSVFIIFNFLFIILPKNRIYLTSSINTSSFWKRNSDKINFGIITAVVTSLLSFLFFKFTGYIP